jgi:hypothetical protein
MLCPSDVPHEVKNTYTQNEQPDYVISLNISIRQVIDVSHTYEKVTKKLLKLQYLCGTTKQMPTTKPGEDTHLKPYKVMTTSLLPYGCEDRTLNRNNKKTEEAKTDCSLYCLRESK